MLYAPQLDGLRAVAVAAVAWSHWERDYQFGIPFGTGVHLFYVLSGFLITGILLGLRDHASRWSAVRAFYIRRALRIFPAFYLTLAVAWLADVPPVRETIAWHVSYLSNVQIFVTGQWPGAISHFWSLAVEEQFYLLWPWLIVFAPRRWLAPALLIAVAASPLFRWWLATEGYRETLWGVLTPGSMDSLGVGALVAVGWSTATRSPKNVVPGSIVWIALAAYIGLLFFEARHVALPLPVTAIKQTLQAIVFSWLVLRAAIGVEGFAGRVLSAAPVVYLGRISYGVYLAHGFAGAMLGAAGLSSAWLPEPIRFLSLCTVTVAAAAASWHLMEVRFNRLKRLAPYADAASGPRVSLDLTRPRPLTPNP